MSWEGGRGHAVDTREKVRIWRESGLGRFALRVVELAAEHVGTVALESLDCGLVYFCCDTVGRLCSLVPSEGDTATEQLATRLLHLANWVEVPTWTDCLTR